MKILSETIDLMNIIFAAILFFLVIILIGYHIYSEMKAKLTKRVEEKFLLFINGGEASAGQISTIRQLYTLNGIRALEAISKKLNDKQISVLRNAVSTEKFLEFLRKKLKSEKQTAAVLATKLVIALKLNQFTPEIVNNLCSWKENSEAQQISLLALFSNGCKKELVEVLSDPEFTLLVSFRVSQELVENYKGDKVDFCRTMLSEACDNYITRACLTTIGNENITELAGMVMAYLDSENINLLISAIRALGNLKYQKAKERLVVMLQESNWELICAIVEALAKIDPENCYDIIFPFVFHEKWWVRFRTAEALASVSDSEKLLGDIALAKDKFALEMVTYMIEKNILLKAGEKNV